MTEAQEASAVTPCVLAVEDLTVTRHGVTVLRRLTLRVDPGEVVAVRGPSGCGKSTLLLAVAGLIPVQAGSLRVDGHEVVGASDARRSTLRRSSVGLVFQSDELLPELNLAENVSMPLRLGGRWKAGADQQVSTLLERLEIGHLATALPAHVSGGQLQRAAIARALIHRPGLLLADEPTAALDGRMAMEAMSVMVELAREVGAGALVVTHDDAVAARCDRVVTLEALGVNAPEVLVR